MKKTILLILAVFLLSLNMVFSADITNDNTLLVYWTSDKNTTWNNATNYQADGGVILTPTFHATDNMVGSGATEFTVNTDDTIVFNNTGLADSINFTMSCWLNKTEVSVGNPILGRYPGTNDPGDWRIIDDDRPTEGNNNIRFQIFDGDGDFLQGTMQDDTQLEGGHKNMIVFRVNQTLTSLNAYLYFNATLKDSGSLVQSTYAKTAHNLTIGNTVNAVNQAWGFYIDECMYFNKSLTEKEIEHIWTNGTVGNTLKGEEAPAPDTTPPHITAYSDQGSSCSDWNTATSNPCSTGDTTPTLYFNTSEAANCAIGINNLNYTTMGSSRNCTSGEGTTEHACTLTLQDEFVYEDSTVYLSCKDTSGNENITSTSGPLSLTVTGLETGGDTAIGIGVQNALLSGYTNYTNQQIYARNLAGQQDYGTFDWVAKKGSKVWAFNYISKGEVHVGLFNMTPVLYILEMVNITNTTIINTVETMINATK